MKRNLIAILSLVTSACASEDVPAQAPVDLRLTDGPAGPIVADGARRALYLFGDDTPGGDDGAGAVSRCVSDACLATWRPFVGEIGEVGGVSAALLGHVTRPDGTAQITYRGWPLYYFRGDSDIGDLKGEGFAGVWFSVPEPFYDVMIGRDATLGRYLTTPGGLTLYWFGADVPSFGGAPAQNTCTGACTNVWSTFGAAGARIPSTLRAEDFGAAGGGQTTYRGWPLYRFNGDLAPRDTHGDGTSGVWFVAPPAFVDLAVRKSAGKLYLADASGLALYRNPADVAGPSPVSRCGSGCSFAPVDGDPGKLLLPSALDRSKLTRFTRDDGTTQLAYAGQPLYRYRREPGPVGPSGDGVDGFALLSMGQ